MNIFRKAKFRVGEMVKLYEPVKFPGPPVRKFKAGIITSRYHNPMMGFSYEVRWDKKHGIVLAEKDISR